MTDPGRAAHRFLLALRCPVIGLPLRVELLDSYALELGRAIGLLGDLLRAYRNQVRAEKALGP